MKNNNKYLFTRFKIDKISTIGKIIKSLLYLIIIKLNCNFWNPFGFAKDDFLNIIKIKLLGSNHVRREKFYYYLCLYLFNIFNNKFFFVRKKNKSILTEQPFYIYKVKCTTLNKDIDDLIFCGDSHVEFFSRSNLITSRRKKFKNRSIWLGPKTIIGFATDLKIQKSLIKILKTLNNQNSNKNSLIIFCLGSIDIRTTIGYLLATKSILSYNQSIDLILRSYLSLNDGFFRQLEMLNNTKVAFLSIPPVSPIQGIDILNCSVEEAVRYQKDAPFSIFGSPLQRSSWTNILNSEIKSIANEKGYLFVDNSIPYKSVTYKDTYIIDKQYSFDGTHILQPNFYAETIINCCNNSSIS